MADPPVVSGSPRRDPSPRSSSYELESAHVPTVGEADKSIEERQDQNTFSSGSDELPDDLISVLRPSHGGNVSSPPERSDSAKKRRPLSEMKPRKSTPDQKVRRKEARSEGRKSADRESSSTYLTARAHKFSSLKKKKGANSLLNRIFCTSSLTSPSRNDCELNNEVVETSSADDSSGVQENVNPRKKSEEKSSEEGTDSTCATGSFVAAVETASERVTLHDEAKVRETIQDSIQNVIADACAPVEHSSPPTEKASFVEGESKSMVAEARKNFMSPNRSTTPPPCKTTPSKTPGGLVIPSAFSNSAGKSLFPSSIERVFCKPSVSKSPVRERRPISKSPLPPTSTEGKHQASKSPLRVSRRDDGESLLCGSSSDSSGPPPPVSSVVVTNTPSSPKLVRMVGSKEELPTLREVTSSKENPSVSADDDDDEDAFLPNDFVKAPIRRYSEREVGLKIEQKLKAAEEEWKKKQEIQTELRISEALCLAENRFRESFTKEQKQLAKEAIGKADTVAMQKKEEIRASYEKQLREQRETFEKKLGQQKDQIALASRTIQSHQLEVDRLEQLASNSTDEANKLEELQSEIDKIKEERDAAKTQAEGEVISLTRELEACKKELESTISDAALEELRVQLKESQENLQRQVAVNQELHEVEKQNSVDASILEELEAVKTELSKCKNNLEKKASNEEMSRNLTKELELVKSELSKCKSDLAKKEIAAQQLALEAPRKIEEMGDELKKVRARLKEAEEFSPPPEEVPSLVELKRVQAELEEVRSQYETSKADHEASAAETSQVVADLKTELASAQSEIGRLSQQGTPRSDKSVGKPGTPVRGKDAQEVKRLRAQLATVKSSLETREKELTAAKKQIDTPKRSTPQRKSLLKTPPRGGSGRRTSSVSTPDLHEKEKESLRQRISNLEEQAEKFSAEHALALKATQDASEAELQNATREIEKEKESLLQKIENLEKDTKTAQSELLKESQNNENLLQKISNLEEREGLLVKQHEDCMNDLRQANIAELNGVREELETCISEGRQREVMLQERLSETESVEREGLLEKLSSLETELEAERRQAFELSVKLAESEKEAKEFQESHAGLNEDTSRLKAEVEMLSKSLQSTQRELESKLVCEKTLETEWKEKLSQLKRDHDQALHIALESGRKECTQLKTQIDELHQANAERIRSREAELRTEFESMKELENTSLRNEISSLKEAVSRHEARVLEINEAHTKELDELLVQLDEVEAEHKQKILAKESLIKENESNLASLTSKLKTENVDSLSKLAASEKELSTVREELAKTKEEQERFTSVAELKLKKACDEAREEMILRAEEQFKQANQLYVKLKKQYDLVKSKADSLEAELRKSKTAVEQAQQDKESSEVDLHAEVAELKAAKAKAKAESASKAKEYRHEMAGLLKTAKEFENKCTAAEERARTAEKTVETLKAEKKKLKAENVDLNQVCEELMAHVEKETHEC